MEKKVRVDIGCGHQKRKGFIGIDLQHFSGVDKIHDISKGLHSFKDSSVDEVYSSHFLDYLPGEIDDFLEGIHRICKDGAKIEFVVTYNTHYTALIPGKTLRYFELWFIKDYVYFNELFDVEEIYFDYLPIAYKLSKKFGIHLRDVRKIFNNTVTDMHIILKCLKEKRNKFKLKIEGEVYCFYNDRWKLEDETNIPD